MEKRWHQQLVEEREEINAVEVERKTRLKLKYHLSFEEWKAEKAKQKFVPVVETSKPVYERESDPQAFEKWLQKKKQQKVRMAKAPCLSEAPKPTIIPRKPAVPRQSRRPTPRPNTELSPEEDEETKQLQERKKMESEKAFKAWKVRKAKEQAQLLKEKDARLTKEAEIEKERHRKTWKKKNIVLAYSCAS